MKRAHFAGLGAFPPLRLFQQLSDGNAALVRSASPWIKNPFGAWSRWFCVARTPRKGTGTWAAAGAEGRISSASFKDPRRWWMLKCCLRATHPRFGEENLKCGLCLRDVRVNKTPPTFPAQQSRGAVGLGFFFSLRRYSCFQFASNFLLG